MSELHKFVFDGLPVRGMLVRLDDSWQDLLKRRETPFPLPVRTLLGELTAAAVLMQANLKFNGALVLQMHGDGPLKLLVAEAQSDLRFRATATVKGDVSDTDGLQDLLNPQGKGRCAITLVPEDPQPGQQPYQGVVPLYGDRREPLHELAQVLEHYMLQSEQLDTRLVLAANEHMAAGLLIQRMPVQGERNLGGRNEDEIGLNEGFNRVAHLAATLTREELLTLDANTLLRRLFWEETLTRYEPLRPRFSCSCSRERVRNMMLGLGQAEVDSIVAERGDVEVGCEFCGHAYRFDKVDVAELFTPPAQQAPGSVAVN